MSGFTSLEVLEVRRETPDAVSIRFAYPAEAPERFRFLPGQYLTLKLNDAVRRSYSICASPDDGELRVAVKRVPGGVFSGFANEALRPGTSLDVAPPEGRFTVPVEPTKSKRYLAIAAGSGITPILSVVKTVLEREPQSRVLLLYGNRTSGDILFAEALEDLKNRFLGRFTLIHILSREAQDVPVLNGRIDEVKIRTFAAQLGNIDYALICGPAAMATMARDTLLDHGLASERIKTELFLAPDAPAQTATQPVAVGAEIEAVLDGKRLRFTFAPDDTGVVDAALRQGLDLPYSCKGGMCCTCRAKLVEGEAEMTLNYSLEAWEIEAGFVLACQARPKSARLVLDFDHV